MALAAALYPSAYCNASLLCVGVYLYCAQVFNQAGSRVETYFRVVGSHINCFCLDDRQRKAIVGCQVSVVASPLTHCVKRVDATYTYQHC